MSDPYLGEIRLVGFNFAPVGWAFCQGQLTSISQNTALFSLLGTFYGGNGVSTFGLPDLRSRVPVGFGQGLGLSNYDIGQTGGTETVSLLATQMPAHNHLLNVSNATGSTPDPTNAYLAEGNIGTARQPAYLNSYTTSAPTGTAAAAALSLTGGSQPHSNLQPLLALNYIIALQGIFPARN